MYLLAAVYLLFSGIAALTYQVTWVRLLGLSMGSTSASISTVLAAFFLGLALGSYFAERISRNRIHSLKPYILLELVIGVCGLILLPTLLNLDNLMAQTPTLGSSLTYKFAITLLLLLLPTLAMGATFPVMAAILIRKESDLGSRLSMLYSLNTAGAVLGALLSGFWFIPSWGLDGAIYIAVGLNLLIVVSGLYFSRTIRLPELQPDPQTAATNSSSNNLNQKLALAVLFATGFVSIATEVGWTKYLSIFTGTTIYGFAAILAIFLFGITAGSWFMKSRIQNIGNPLHWLAYTLLLAGFSLLLTRAGLSMVPAVYEGINHMSISSEQQQLLKYFIVFVLLFIPTFLFGAIFPVNIKLYCGDLSGVQSKVGKAYAVNTVASILGSIAAGFWLIPSYGTDSMLGMLGLILILLPLSFMLAPSFPVPRLALTGTTVVLLLMQWPLPHISYKSMISSVDYVYDNDAMTGKEPNFLFIKEGKAGVISLVTHDNHYAKVQANGLNESILNMQDTDQALVIESLLAYMPYFLHPDPKTAFVVGYGGGITTRAFTHTPVESIHVVELEPSVVDAAHSLPDGPVLALSDPRVTLTFNDARNTLLVENKKYDLIAAQPSHPWRAGAANVFTQEFWEIVNSRLTDEGVFSQWINLFRMDVTTLKSLLKAFNNVFPHTVSFANMDTGDLMLIGAKQALVFDIEQIDARMARKQITKALSYHQTKQASDLLWYFALSQAEMKSISKDSIANRDTNILSEVRLSAFNGIPGEAENPYTFLYDNYTFDLTSYLPEKENVAQRLYDAGIFFLKWDQPDTTGRIVKQLEKVDEVYARSLQHEWLYWQHKHEEASDWYVKYDNWLDITHATQMNILLERGSSKEAKTLIGRIKEKSTQITTMMEWLYKTGDLEALLKLTPGTDAQLKWWLLAYAEKDIHDAGWQMQSLISDDSTELEQLRFLVRYHAASFNEDEMNQRQRQVVKHLDTLIKRYKLLFEKALQEDDINWADALLNQVKLLDPDDEDITSLEKKLHKAINESSVVQVDKNRNG